MSDLAMVMAIIATKPADTVRTQTKILELVRPIAAALESGALSRFGYPGKMEYVPTTCTDDQVWELPFEHNGEALYKVKGKT